MTNSQAQQLITEIADQDYSAGGLHDDGTVTRVAALRSIAAWYREPSQGAQVREAVELIGNDAAENVYRAAIEAAHADEYDL
jgi:hypothetical protein